MEKKLLSIVVPSYNEQEALPYFYKAIKEIESKLSEILVAI